MIVWFVRLVGIDIAFEVSDLSRYLAVPRTGYLVKTLHVFRYLEIHNANDLAFNPCYQCVTSDQNIQSKVQAMKDFHFDGGEEIPPNAPKPRGKKVRKTSPGQFFVNSDHAGDRSTRRSQTGIIYILIQNQ